MPEPAKRGVAIRDAVDTVELGLGDGRCGEPWRSGEPLAWKNFGCARSSPILDPTTEAEELWGAGIESPLA